MPYSGFCKKHGISWTNLESEVICERCAIERKHFFENNIPNVGLTKRELFAAMAMLGQIPVEKDTDLGKVAAWSVQYADELIAALDRVEKTAAPAIVEQVVRP